MLGYGDIDDDLVMGLDSYDASRYAGLFDLVDYDDFTYTSDPCELVDSGGVLRFFFYCVRRIGLGLSYSGFFYSITLALPRRFTSAGS